MHPISSSPDEDKILNSSMDLNSNHQNNFNSSFINEYQEQFKSIHHKSHLKRNSSSQSLKVLDIHAQTTPNSPPFNGISQETTKHNKTGFSLAKFLNDITKAAEEYEIQHQRKHTIEDNHHMLNGNI